jgi:5-methyltetrahydropteroyltriglutamate--homocysteine methyltransferase
MQHSSQRILTTHVGSLVRTSELVELEIQKVLGKRVDPVAYESTLRAGVTDVVAQQQRIGLDIVDDGEYGKLNWITYLSQRLQGLAVTDLRLTDEQAAAFWPEQARFGEFYKAYQRVETAHWLPAVPSLPEYHENHLTDYANVVCRGALSYNPVPLQRDIANLHAAMQAAGARQAFMPVVAPGSFETVRNEFYASQEDYLFALAGELNKEYRMIVDAGFTLQVDDAAMAGNYYARFLGKPMSEYLAWAEVRVEALNRALKDIPPDRVRVHMCFGSQNIPHTTDPTMRDLIGLLLTVKAQGYMIEASNPRHEHEWRIWNDVKLPAGKVLMPGVVSHATNIVEHPELIAMRICNFASLVGRENVVASTDCGFSQGWNSPRVHAQVQWAKLESLVEGARRASQTLWGRAAA